MTNIICSDDCIYQQNGLCIYDNIDKKNLDLKNDCIYYEQKEKNNGLK